MNRIPDNHHRPVTQETKAIAIKDRIRDYVTQTDYVSFAGLTNRFGADFSDGDYAISLRENLFVWAGLTKDACEAIEALRAEGSIVYACTLHASLCHT